MKVQYLGKSNNLLKNGENYDIDFVCGNKGGYVIVGDSHQIVYDDIVELALDWDILGDNFVTRQIYEQTMRMFTVLP